MPAQRPGWGVRHPALVARLERDRPVATEEAVWGAGTRLRIGLHLGPFDPALDPLVTSVRCVVRSGDGVVVCTNAGGGRHAVPGGRREGDESFAETATREVHEETGWHVDPATLEPIAWLHLHYLTPVEAAWAHAPHPDFLQVVFTGSGVRRDTAADGTEWSDVEGWEVAACVLEPAEAAAAMTGTIDRLLVERATGRR